MKRYLLAILLFAHVALAFMMFGAGLLDVFIFFPSWFHNMPDSLVAAKQFTSYRNPGMFFIPITLLVILTGVGFVVAAWRSEAARVWVLVDVVLFVTVLVMTGAFIYPRIYTVVGQDSGSLTLETMQQIATEMTVLIQVRITFVAIAAAFAILALWRFTGKAPNSIEPIKAEG